jgi:plastocyanin
MVLLNVLSPRQHGTTAYHIAACTLWLACLFLAGIHHEVAAATVKVNVHDATEKAVDQAVVALVPKKLPDYAGQPTAIMDQRNNTFVPGVLAVRVNTLVHFPNSDDIRHHVYSFSPAKRFELRLYHGLTADPVLFDKPGQVILGCNIHDSMLGYIYVLETAWFGVTDQQGVAIIEDVPSGEYQLQTYHPRLDPNQPDLAETLSLSDQQIIQKTVRLPSLLPDPRSLSTENELESLFKR